MTIRSLVATLAVAAASLHAASAPAATITVTRSGSGAGSVVADAGAINCGATCSGPYASGTTLTLSAAAAAGSVFTGWLGRCTGSGACVFTVAGDSSVSATFAPASSAPPSLDIDANGALEPLTDGLMAIRYLFGLSGNALINLALGANPRRGTAPLITGYLDDIRPALDIDGNGQADALTDGVLIIRYIFGLRGSGLITNAIGPGATRSSAADIESLLQLRSALNLMPVVSAGMAQAITLPASAQLSGSAADDGKPAMPGTLALEWTQVSGPGTATFGTPNAASTTASFTTPGVYVLRLSASDGALTGSATVQVTVSGLVTTTDAAGAVEKMIGPAGGTLETTSGGLSYKVTIPPEALPSSALITVTPVTSIPNLPLFSGGLVAGVHLQPSGLQFARPLTLTMTFASAVNPAGLVGFLVSDSGVDLEIGKVAVAGPQISLQLTHFSNAGVAQSALGDFARDIRPILDSLSLPVSSRVALSLIERVGAWIGTYTMAVCSGTDLCERAFSIAAESLSQNQQQACNQAQSFNQQGEPFLARTAVQMATGIAAELLRMSAAADALLLPGFDVSLDLTCIVRELKAAADVAKGQAIANVRAGLLTLLVEISGDGSVLGDDSLSIHADAAMRAVLLSNLNTATTLCISNPVGGETIIDVVLRLSVGYIDSIEPGLATKYIDARAGCRVTISPALPTVGFEEQVTFSGFVNGVTPNTLTWALPGITLGSTITPGGLFTAGQIEGTVEVLATSTADPGKYKRTVATIVNSCAAAPAESPLKGEARTKAAAACQPLEAAGGTFRNFAGSSTGTALLVRLRMPNGSPVSSAVNMTIQGPAGWNGGQPFALSYPAGLLRQFYAVDKPPISGSYSIGATVGGTAVADTFTIDASQTLGSPDPVVPDYTPVSALGSSWAAVAGAASYLTRVFDITNQRILTPVVFTAATSATLQNVQLTGDAQKALQVFAFSTDMQPPDPPMPATFNMSFHRALLTPKVTVTPARTSVAQGATVSLSATVTGLPDQSVTWSASGGQLASSGNSAQWTAPQAVGTYTVTAKSVVNQSFRGNSTVTVGSGNTCSPELAGELLKGRWQVSSGNGNDQNCSTWPPFKNFINGGEFTIVHSGGADGAIEMPGGLSGYVGKFQCGPQGGKFFGSSVPGNFVAALQEPTDQGEQRLGAGVILYSTQSPNLRPCMATIEAMRQ